MIAIKFPKQAKILKVGIQTELYSDVEYLTFWALVDPDEKETEIKKFRIAGTGHEINVTFSLVYLDTVLCPSGLVFHVFEKLAHRR